MTTVSSDSKCGSSTKLIVLPSSDRPPEAGLLKIKDFIPAADIQVWDGAAHGLYWTRAERVNELILGVWTKAL